MCQSLWKKKLENTSNCLVHWRCPLVEKCFNSNSILQLEFYEIIFSWLLRLLTFNSIFGKFIFSWSLAHSRVTSLMSWEPGRGGACSCKRSFSHGLICSKEVACREDTVLETLLQLRWLNLDMWRTEKQSGKIASIILCCSYKKLTSVIKLF